MCHGIQVIMAGSETSFDSYTFTYNWKINSLETRLHNPVKLNSPPFSSPSETRPATKWMLTVYKINVDDPSLSGLGGLVYLGTPPAPQQSLSLDITRLACSPIAATGSGVTNIGLQSVGQPGIQFQFGGISGQGGRLFGSLAGASPPQKQNDDAEAVWVEASVTPNILTGNVTSPGLGHPNQGPIKLNCVGGTNVMSFQNFMPISKVRGSKSVTFSCQIKVWSLDKPVHVPKELQPSPNSANTDEVSDFNLSEHMEEARQNGLFTDVTLVAEGKEFKAHKVVLASQSQFFKTRFSTRWSDPGTLGYTTGDRVEMTDVPAVIMEATLSYMYTGKVTDIRKVAHQLLPVSEEYGLIRLRKMCEKALIKSLTDTNAINVLILAAAHNAPDLKKASMDFIVSNTAAVKQSEGWGKLKQTQTHRDLWMDLLENIAERHSTANSTGIPNTRAPQLPGSTRAPQFGITPGFTFGQ
jgi:hypothetical protein